MISRFPMSVSPLLIATLALAVPTMSAPANEPDRVVPIQDQGQSPTPAPADDEPTISTDRPGFSDNTSITPVGRLVLETGYTFTHRDDGATGTDRHNGPELLLRTGLCETVELRLSTSGYVWTRTGGGGPSDTNEGFSDVAVGLKWLVMEQDGILPRLALEGLTTVGTGGSAASNREVEPTFKLICSYDLGESFTLLFNANAAFPRVGGDRFTQGQGSVALSFAPIENTSIFIEYFVIGPAGPGLGAAHSVDFGGALLLDKRTQIDARIGFGLNDEADDVFVGAGISFLF